MKEYATSLLEVCADIFDAPETQLFKVTVPSFSSLYWLPQISSQQLFFSLHD